METGTPRLSVLCSPGQAERSGNQELCPAPVLAPSAALQVGHGFGSSPGCPRTKRGGQKTPGGGSGGGEGAGGLKASRSCQWCDRGSHL